MLDTKAAKYVQPLLNFFADRLFSFGISANQVTGAALVAGLAAAAVTATGHVFIGAALLWLSALFDGIDGALARKTGTTSQLGTLFDVVFDRIVEIALLWAVVFIDRTLVFAAAFVLSAIILSMTVFLTVGAIASNSGKKTFYYQTGLAERCEGLIMLSLSAIIAPFRLYILFIFAAMVLFTAGQRFVEAVKIFSKINKDEKK